MAPLATTLFFAALASAQTANITTTAWLTKFAGSDKYGYVASVINADDQHMTVALDADSDADVDSLHIGGFVGNFTLGREASSFTVKESVRRAAPTPTTNMYIQVACTRPAQQDDDVTCESVYGDGYARLGWCNEQVTRTDRQQPPNSTTTYPHTYGSGIWGGPGSEIITQKFEYPLVRQTTTPEWCTSDEVPASALSRSHTTSAAEFGIYQIVIHAGQEKLSDFTAKGTPSATASAGGSASTAASATQSTATGSTGAAGKVHATLPAIAGMGVMAVFAAL